MLLHRTNAKTPSETSEVVSLSNQSLRTDVKVSLQAGAGAGAGAGGGAGGGGRG